MACDKTLLVVAAHPDDEVLGCGATVARRVREGWVADLVIMTRGVAGRDAGGVADRAAQAELERQMRVAAEVIGFRSVAQLDFPDNRLDTVSRMDLSHAIRAVVEEKRPNVVFTHHPGDYNWDHTRVFDATMMATRANAGDFFPSRVLTFEVLSSTERSWQEPGRAFHPNIWVDVAATIDSKKLALSYYQSEYRPYPHPRSIEAVEYLARKRGGEVGLAYAEAFHLVRSIED